MADMMHAMTIIPAGDARRRWIDETLEWMHERGMTFIRISHPPGTERRIYVEGWRKKPVEQGPHPWEAGQPAPDVITTPARPA